MKIGALELVVIFIVVLLVIGPDKLPQYARKFGNAMREFRKASADVTQELKESVIDPLEEAQAPLREAMQPIEELDQSLKSDIKDVEDSIKDLGKSKPKAPESSAESAENDAAPENGSKTEKSEGEAT
ncbi:MAG: twin-arginine translocase TatA/TatE family subunit [Oscillospiraceae bacterium]|nr:twin-arginine translocase TatA/TatE family subunit [Oscillospiraceae bacterium]